MTPTTLHSPAAADIDELRSGLTEKLTELRRRADHARAVISPSTYLSKPIVWVGLAAAIGALIGSATHDRSISARGSVAHTIFRTALAATVAAVVRHVLEDATRARASVA